MRILWFSPTPSLFTNKTWAHNGGGWISSLQKLLDSEGSNKLGIAFNCQDNELSQEIDGVKYYPVHFDFSIKERLNKSKQLENLIKKSLKILNDFQPDIIHLFGSESWYGKLVNYTKIPIVIHMQGSLPSYYNARYPPGISKWSKITSLETSLKQKIMTFREDSTFLKNSLQEEDILKENKYFMGRTHWDKAIINFYNPNAEYFLCEEVLRESFIKSKKKWKYKKREKIVLTSVISGPLYKGVDVILKTARMLRDHSSIKFEWNICGVNSISFFESTYGIQAITVNVKICGTLTEAELQKKLIESTFFVHLSYIDNSPNSVCEAQILGLPVIATDVGGVSTLVNDNKTGFLVPANDPLMTAYLIEKHCNDEELLQKISSGCKDVASVRHDPLKIKKNILSIYEQIIKRGKVDDS